MLAKDVYVDESSCSHSEDIKKMDHYVDMLKAKVEGLEFQFEDVV